MWLPRELLTALRYEVKERKWCPLGAADWSDVKRWLYVESQYHVAAAKREELEKSGDLGVATFRIRMAAPTYGMVRFEDRENF